MIDFKAIAHQFDTPEIDAIVLMGSHARGDAGPFSDIDLIRFTSKPDFTAPLDGSHIINDHLVVVNTATPSTVEQWFTEPEQVTNVIGGVRIGQPLIDKKGVFATILDRAATFVWDEAMQEKANRYASREMVGWIEEVHKGLNGLHTDHIGQLLNARFGLSWGLTDVIKVQRGVLLTGDNGIYEEVVATIGESSVWAKLCRVAFGIPSEENVFHSLHEEIRAGLNLYIETARLLDGIFQPKDGLLIQHTVNLIRKDVRF